MMKNIVILLLFWSRHSHCKIKNPCPEEIFGQNSYWRRRTENYLIEKGQEIVNHLDTFNLVSDTLDPETYFQDYASYCKTNVVDYHRKYHNLKEIKEMKERSPDENSRCKSQLICPALYDPRDHLCIFPYYGNERSEPNTRSTSHHLVQLHCNHGLVGAGHTLRCDPNSGNWIETLMTEKSEETGELTYSGTFIEIQDCYLPNEEKWENDRNFIDVSQIIMLLSGTLSILALLPAIAIFLYYPNLRCIKNYIHVNLMMSFIFRITYDNSKGFLNLWFFNQYLKISYPNNTKTRPAHDWPMNIPQVILTNSSSLPLADLENRPFSAVFYKSLCILWTLLGRFSQLANYFWLMNEGIYLYNLLNLTRLLGDCSMRGFLFIGWGIPLFFILINVLIASIERYHENSSGNFSIYTSGLANTTIIGHNQLASDYEKQTKICWEIGQVFNFIVQIPIIISIFINFVIFVAVSRTISSKMRKDQAGRMFAAVGRESAVTNDGNNYQLDLQVPGATCNGESSLLPPNSSSQNHNLPNVPIKNIRLIKSILMLMPLLGVHFILVNILRLFRPYYPSIDKYGIIVDNMLTYFEGFIIAYFYCFRNKEVRDTLKREFVKKRSRSSNSLSGNQGEIRRRSSVTYMGNYRDCRYSLTPLTTAFPLSRGTTTTKLDDPRESANSNNSLTQQRKDSISQQAMQYTNNTSSIDKGQRSSQEKDFSSTCQQEIISLQTHYNNRSINRSKQDSNSSHVPTGNNSNNPNTISGSYRNFIMIQQQSTSLNSRKSTQRDSLWANFKYRVNLVFYGSQRRKYKVKDITRSTYPNNNNNNGSLVTNIDQNRASFISGSYQNIADHHYSNLLRGHNVVGPTGANQNNQNNLQNGVCSDILSTRRLSAGSYRSDVGIPVGLSHYKQRFNRLCLSVGDNLTAEKENQKSENCKTHTSHSFSDGNFLKPYCDVLDDNQLLVTNNTTNAYQPQIIESRKNSRKCEETKN